jgi:hypothetical protein
MTFDRLSMVQKIAAVLSWAALGGCYDLTPVPSTDAGSCPPDMPVVYGCASQSSPEAGELDASADVDESAESSR